MILKSMTFPLTVPNRTSNLRNDFSLQSPSFTAAFSLKLEKIGLLILLNCEAASLTVFATMCPKEKQTSDNLIVNNYCSVIEIFDKFSFSG